MKTRQGDGTEALSKEMESNGSAAPKSRRHPLTLPADGRGALPPPQGIRRRKRIIRFGFFLPNPPPAANARRWPASDLSTEGSYINTRNR